MSNKIILNAGDEVYYIGSKFRSELVSKDGRPVHGWIHSRVRGTEDKFVVEFPELKEPDFIMSVDVLARWKETKEKSKHTGPEVQPRRKRTSEDDA